MNKTLIIRKAGPHFFEAVYIRGEPAATRLYETWEQVERRLGQLGIVPEEVNRVKVEFESGAYTISFRVP